MRSAPSRRDVLATAAAATTGLAGCGGRLGLGNSGDVPPATGTPPTDAATPAELPDAVGLEAVATGLDAPLGVAFAPDADRRYVADQVGVVHAHGPDGLAGEPALDLRDAVEFGGEKGLLGLALHPGFATNRRAFVRYSAPPRAGTPSGYSHTFVLAEFEAAADGRLRRDSERTVLEIPEPQANHNAGDLAFGPDGYLYVAVGDGGGAGDRGEGHVEDWYDANGGGNGQDVGENLLGSILRIDVDSRPAGDRAYAVPEDNPLVGREGLDEQYAWGLRNPWRMSFDVRDPDAGEDGWDLYVADVGQNRYEEVDVVERGGNYGWNLKEGTHCYGASDCPDATPGDVRGGEPLRDPVVEYAHGGGAVSGVSVIGGYVYRGSALPSLSGTYVFGDYWADGRLFAATRPGGPGADGTPAGGASRGLWPTRAVDLAGADAGKVGRLLGFGRDPDGEVYVLGTGDDGGGLYRVVPAE